MQTHGRGQRNNSWVSPYLQNIYFSMRKTVSVDILRNQSLSYDIGCTVRQSLPDNIQSVVLVKAIMIFSSIIKVCWNTS